MNTVRVFAEGVAKQISNYLPEEKNYNNRVCNIGRKASSLIEKSFNKLLRYSLRYLDDLNE